MNATSSAPTATTAAAKTPTSKIVLAAAIAIAGSLIGNTIVAQIALAAGASENFQR